MRRIAVIGAGVAGLSAAWLLRRRYEVELFDRNGYIGGHTHTVAVADRSGTLAVDTGFIVYNEPNYPLLTALFAHLGVATRPTEMSFSASIGGGALEYSGRDLGTLFAQRRNLLRRDFLAMLRDVLRFDARCRALLRDGAEPTLSLGRFLQQHRFGDGFRNHYLLPMAAAIWSCPTETMLRFPAASFARFFENHGLLNLTRRPQWRTVIGGSHRYVERMTAQLPGRVHRSARVARVVRGTDGVELRFDEAPSRRFDGVVIASHADEALALLERPTPLEEALLGRFGYQPNRVVLHRDRTLMPRLRRVWSSWNYLAAADASGAERVSVSYWMNRLQGLDAADDYFVSLNPLREPAPERVIGSWRYDHPVFDAGAIDAQHRLEQIQGRDRIWYCGSYFGYGFHEDALRSAVTVAARLGVTEPWARGAAAAVTPATVRPLPQTG